jgi:recombination protein RecT
MDNQNQTIKKPAENLPAKEQPPNKGALAKFDNTPLGIIKSYCYDPQTVSRIKEMLGKRTSAFLDSIITCVKSNRALQECEPSSVMNAALQAAAVNLPIDPILGYAAIVPYGTKHTITIKGIKYTKVAQFQRMYKGIIQHCLRSNQYRKMRAIEVYSDELADYNPITGDITFTDSKTWKLRYQESEACIALKKIAGVYFYFRLTSGFECENFMPKDVAMAHGRRYSKAYQADLKNKTQLSLWSTNPVPMMIKTNIITTLTKYGVMSIELSDIFKETAEDFEGAAQMAQAQIESSMGSEPIETTFEPEKDPKGKSKKAKKSKTKGKPQSTAETEKHAEDVLGDKVYTCETDGCENEGEKLKKDDDHLEFDSDGIGLCCPACGMLVVEV